MKENSKRKGIWIPLEILGNNSLDPTNKILLSEILSLTELPDGCFASNQYFAELLGLTKSSVSKRISSLEKIGYIKTEIKYKNNQCLGRIITKGKVKSQKSNTGSKKNKGSSLGDREVVPHQLGGSSFLDKGVVLEETGGISEEKPINTTINSDKINTYNKQNTITNTSIEKESNIGIDSNDIYDSTSTNTATNTNIGIENEITIGLDSNDKNDSKDSKNLNNTNTSIEANIMDNSGTSIKKNHGGMSLADFYRSKGMYHKLKEPM